MKNIMPTSADTVNFINSCTDLLTQKGDLITPPIQNWLGDFNRYRTNSDPNCMPTDPFNNSATIAQFLTLPMDSYCCQKNGICGEQYYQHVIQPPVDQDMVNASRVMFLHSPVSTQEDFIRDYDQTHQLIASLQNNLTEIAKNDPLYQGLPQPEIFAYSMFYIYFEQYTYIKGVAVQNLSISMLLLFGIVSAVFGILIAAHLVLLILFTICSMVTLIYVSNVVLGGWGVSTSTYLDHDQCSLGRQSRHRDWFRRRIQCTHPAEVQQNPWFQELQNQDCS
jgi:Niemann-Pick C1 protein